MRLFIPLFRASRSLNNKVSTAQHEAILAQVFCDEVELVVHFQYVPSFFLSYGYIRYAEQFFAKMTPNHLTANIDPSGRNSPGNWSSQLKSLHETDPKYIMRRGVAFDLDSG